MRAGDVEVVRRLYAAVNARDAAAPAACLTPDTRWTLPGRSPTPARTWGWNQLHDQFLAKLAPQSGGTFRAELLDVTVGERFVVSVHHATAALDTLWTWPDAR